MNNYLNSKLRWPQVQLYYLLWRGVVKLGKAYLLSIGVVTSTGICVRLSIIVKAVMPS